MRVEQLKDSGERSSSTTTELRVCAIDLSAANDGKRRVCVAAGPAEEGRLTPEGSRSDWRAWPSQVAPERPFRARWAAAGRGLIQTALTIASIGDVLDADLEARRMAREEVESKAARSAVA